MKIRLEALPRLKGFGHKFNRKGAHSSLDNYLLSTKETGGNPGVIASEKNYRGYRKGVHHQRPRGSRAVSSR